MPSTDQFISQAYLGGGDPVLTLLRVNIDGTMYYFVNNTESISSNVSGSVQTYQRGMFNIALPEDKESDSAPTATIQFEAGDIQTIRALRSANKRVLIDLWVVLASAPNIVEYGPASFESDSVDISASSVSLSLVSEPILDIQYPGYRFTPELFPALWRNQLD